MKQTFGVALTFAAAQALPTDEAVKLVEGFFIGAFGEQHLGDVSECIADVDPVVTDFEKALAEFEKGTYAGIATGVYDLGHAVASIDTVLDACAEIDSADRAKLIDMSSAFKHPVRLTIEAGKHLIVNGQDIWLDVKHGHQAYSSSFYSEAG